MIRIVVDLQKILDYVGLQQFIDICEHCKKAFWFRDFDNIFTDDTALSYVFISMKCLNMARQ